jgi:Fe-S oxidoreductase
LIADSIVLPPVRDYLKNIMVGGNPYKEPAATRENWAKGTPIEVYTGQEYLFYVGCVGSYDEPAKKIARAVGGLLLKAGLIIGILGEKETCDRNEVRALGAAILAWEKAVESI